MSIQLSPQLSGLQQHKQVKQPSFSGVKEFAQALADSGVVSDPKKAEKAIASNFQSLFSNLSPESAVSIYDSMGKSPGLESFINTAAKGIPTGERKTFVEDVTAISEKISKDLPRGQVEMNVPIDYKGKSVKNGCRITVFGKDGKDKTLEFPAINRNNQVYSSAKTDFEAFKKAAFGDGNRLIICPVGWTTPNIDMFAANNPEIQQSFQKAAKSIAKALGKDQGKDFDAVFTKTKKAIVGEYYDKAFKKFWGPVYDLLHTKLGVDAKNLGFITSASNAGIDKSAMEFGHDKGIAVANVTPWDYANWADPEGKDPLYITNTIEEYADACSDLSDLLMVTGGRNHSLEKDVQRALIQNRKPVIVVDVLNEAYGFNVPSQSNGSLENVAKYLEESGMDLASNAYAKKQIADAGELTDSQKLAATVIYKLCSRLTDVDQTSIANSQAESYLQKMNANK